jgi:hypothetical protein
MPASLFGVLIMQTFLSQFENVILFVLGAFDRVVVKGRIQVLSFAEGVEMCLNARHIRYFDYEKQYAAPYRDSLVAHVKNLASNAGLEIEYVERKNFRMDDKIERIIEKRGSHPGLVHIFSVKEPGPQYKPWYDNDRKRACMRQRQGLYLHYYLYYIDERLGLIYVRVGTYLPSELQIYFNGHSYLAAQMMKKNIGHTKVENTFTSIDNPRKAYCIADELSGKTLSSVFNAYARKIIPFISDFEDGYRWTFWQAEYSYDIVFKDRTVIPNVFERIVRDLITVTKPQRMASFFDKRLGSAAQGRSSFQIAHGVLCVKFQFHKTSVKMYLKADGQVLRIECTTNNVSEFRAPQPYESDEGKRIMKVGNLRKHISSLTRLRRCMHGVTQRFLDYVSKIVEPSCGHDDMHDLSKTTRDTNGHAYRGFNLFDKEDEQLLRSVNDPSYQINGFRNKDIRMKLSGEHSRAITVKLRRLREKGLIKKAPRSRKYYATERGKGVFITGEWLLNYFVQPALTPV